ncbi:MAG: Putative oxidoreductase, partial [uncultured Friedmanniella sp.]
EHGHHQPARDHRPADHRGRRGRREDGHAGLEQPAAQRSHRPLQRELPRGAAADDRRRPHGDRHRDRRRRRRRGDPGGARRRPGHRLGGGRPAAQDRRRRADPGPGRRLRQPAVPPHRRRVRGGAPLPPVGLPAAHDRGRAGRHLRWDRRPAGGGRGLRVRRPGRAGRGRGGHHADVRPRAVGALGDGQAAGLPGAHAGRGRRLHGRRAAQRGAAGDRLHRRGAGAGRPGDADGPRPGSAGQRPARGQPVLRRLPDRHGLRAGQDRQGGLEVDLRRRRAGPRAQADAAPRCHRAL